MEGKLIRTIGQSLLRGSAEGPPESVENTHPANLSEKVAMHRVHDSLKAMKKLDDSWNGQDLQTFRKYHAKNCIERWPNQPPTHGIDGHEQEAIAFFKMFPDQHLINNPYKIMLRQGEWTCTSHGPTMDQLMMNSKITTILPQPCNKPMLFARVSRGIAHRSTSPQLFNSDVWNRHGYLVSPEGLGGNAAYAASYAAFPPIADLPA
jgi:hypothetical protein